MAIRLRRPSSSLVRREGDVLRRGRSVVLIRAAAAACLLSIATHFYAFAQGDLSGDAPSGLSAAGKPPRQTFQALVVFTGAYERIDLALDLLQADVAPRLFISGANPNAGIWLDRFTKQFGRGRDDLAQLIACCASFGEAADTTLQNAAETACWLDARGLRGPVALVTSWDHMPRAYVALAKAIDAARITRIAVGAPADGAANMRWLTQEYLKLWGTRLVTWAPRRLVVESYGPFRDGCPRAAQ